MKRFLFSTKALWHVWRALRLTRRARALLDASEAHTADATLNLMALRSLARAPKPVEPGGPGFAGQVLLASLIGLAICTVWIWISVRIGI